MQKYGKSYYISRIKLEEAFNNNQTLKYFIDLHRDGVKKEVSTAVINGTSYAKLMFFLGLGHENSKDNQKLVNDLENIIKKDYKEILRNTFIRKNDSYNQDLSPNSFLIPFIIYFLFSSFGLQQGYLA